MGRGENSRLWREIAKRQRAKGLPCFHCGQPIDYSLKWPDPGSFSADHLKPYVTNAELRYDPGNVVSSHLRCNQTKGASSHYSAGLGNLSEKF
jgi:hypothetical protein